jgi:hypothetical protein
VQSSLFITSAPYGDGLTKQKWFYVLEAGSSSKEDEVPGVGRNSVSDILM